MFPSSCIILVPAGHPIVPGCERALQVLEKWGYTVRRVPGFSAIDFGRCAMAGEALRDGFEELMWIDSDTVFDPEAIVRLREHQLPLTGVLCPKKGIRQFACDFLPGTEKVLFGAQGGLMEVHYVGFGFVHTRREIYERIQQHLKLPVCNERFGESIVPWFFPLIVDDEPGQEVVSPGRLCLLRAGPPRRLSRHGRHHHPPRARRQRQAPLRQLPLPLHSLPKTKPHLVKQLQ